MDVDWRCNNNNDQVYPRDVAPPRLGEGVLPRDSCGFSGRWGPAWRCLVAKCFDGNSGDEEKPRKTSKRLTPNEASRLVCAFFRSCRSMELYAWYRHNVSLSVNRSRSRLLAA